MALARYDTMVRSVVGPAAAGAQVYIVSQPAITNTIPPSPLVPLFSDNAGVNPKAQPLVADGFGHAFAYLASGIYTVVIVLSATVQQVYPDQQIGSVAGSTLLLETNSVPNIVQSLLNIKGTGGTTVSADGSGGVTITTPPAGSNTQIQYNNASAFGASPNLSWNNAIGAITILDPAGNNGISVSTIVSNLSGRNVQIFADSSGGGSGNGGLAVIGVPDAGIGDLVFYSPTQQDFAHLWGDDAKKSLGVSIRTIGLDFTKCLEITTDSTGILPLLYLWGNVGIVDIVGSEPNAPILKATSGSPEGVVTAKVGSLVLRTDGAIGTSLYVKQTGSGNTGWSGLGAPFGGGVSGKWTGNWGGFSAASGGGGTMLSQFGVDFVAVNPSFATQNPTSTQGKFVKLQSGGGNNGMGYDDNAANITLGILQDWIVKANLIGGTSSRYWIGMWDQAEGPTTGLNTLTPSANLVAFRWDSVTGGNIIAVCQTDNSHQTVVDTGISTAHSVHTYEIVPVGSTVTFYIDGTLVATISTNVPTTSVVMRSIIIGDPEGSIGTSTLEIDLYYFWMLLAS